MLKEFKQKLFVATLLRKEKSKITSTVNVEGGLEEVPEWVEYERKVMLDAVNEVRLGLKLPKVTLMEIAQAETYASGHSDYIKQFALACVRLANNKPIFID